MSRIVQKRAAAIGLDPTLFAGHSLRSELYFERRRLWGVASDRRPAAHKKLDTTPGYVLVAFPRPLRKGVL